MGKCAYCKNNAVDIDAIGLNACADHLHEADEYHKERTGRWPNEDSFLYCDEHCDMWEPGCPRCEECCQHHYGMPVAQMLGEGRNEIVVFSFELPDGEGS
jgi:hypothetical protein